MPRSSRPCDTTSSVAAILASTAGGRNGSHSTRWPMRIVDVRAASALAIVQPSNVSIVCVNGASRWSISHSESKPAASAAWACAPGCDPTSCAAAANTGRTTSAAKLASPRWMCRGPARSSPVVRVASAPRPSRRCNAAGARVACLDRNDSDAAEISITTDVADEEQVVAGVARGGRAARPPRHRGGERRYRRHEPGARPHHRRVGPRDGREPARRVRDVAGVRASDAPRTAARSSRSRACRGSSASD